MRRASATLLGALIAASCVVPTFETVESFDDGDGDDGGAGDGIGGTTNGGTTNGGDSGSTTGGATNGGTTTGGATTGGRGGAGNGGSTGGATSGAGGEAGAGGGCEEGLTQCDGECVDVMQNGDHCGACDMPCSGVCVDGDCGTSCPDGRLRCGNVCCSLPPDHASVSCESNLCEVTCESGYNDCGTGATVECFANADVTHCGPSCLDCRVPNTFASCQDVSGSWGCAYSCASTPLSCVALPTSPPDCGVWGFESGTTEGFTVMEDGQNALEGSLTTSTAWSSTGTRSLAIGFNGDGTNRNIVYLPIPVCRSGSSVDLGGRTLSIVARAETAPGATDFTSDQSDTYFVFADGNTSVASLGDLMLAAGETNTASFPLMDDFPIITDVALYFRVHVAWRGTIYIDDLSFL